jgi:hypothetical protein
VRRRNILALAALAAYLATPRAAGAAEFWFDPTQLPSFTGVVDRYLTNPQGGTDALLFREGPQVIFPPDIAEAVKRVAPAGRRIVVWGIRARSAPVITMLAFAPSAEAQPTLVDRFYWHADRQDPPPHEMQVAGTVRAPYYESQGQVAGAILEDGTVVMLPPDAAAPFKDLLQPGNKLAASGSGTEGPEGKALLASRIGEKPEAMRPVTPAPR